MNIVLLFWILFISSVVGYFVNNFVSLDNKRRIKSTSKVFNKNNEDLGF